MYSIKYVIEVVAFLPVEVGVCKACDLARVAGVKTTVRLEGDDIARLIAILSTLGDAQVRITNPMSLRGLYLMLRHRTGRLPLVLLNGKLLHSGPIDAEAEERLIKALSAEAQ